jgi:ribosome-associated protein
VRRGELVRGMMMPQPKGTFDPPQAEDDPVTPFVYTIALAGDDRKARAIRAIRVSALTSVTTYFVMMTGKTRTQVQAIGANVRDEVKAKLGRDVNPQGDPASGWVVLDYGEAIVHVFTPEVKQFYELEKLWKNGQPLPLEHVVSAEGLSEPVAEEEFDEFAMAEEEDDEIWGDDDADIWG